MIILIHALGFRWDPFDRSGRRLQAAEARAVTAELDAAARRLEVEGAISQAGRIENHQQQALELVRATTRAQAETRNAHDAELPLDPTRADRLADHDRQLCLIAPDICGDAAEADLAAGGNHPLRTGATGRQPDHVRP
ncbi:MAG TPA: hypothetical protein VM471_07645 [Phenylobacterium sp.]|nr:hypothetical protein [Phenylobacterium sp.]